MAGVDQGLGERALEQPREHLDAAVDADVMGRAAPAANERQQLAAGMHEREIGLDVAAVDREHDAAGLACHRTSRARHGAIGEQGVEQAVGELVLAHERICEQRQPRRVAIPRHRRARGEPLVGGDVLDQAEQLGSQRPLLQGHRPVAGDPSGHLDDVVVIKAGERAGVAGVDHLDLVVASRE